MKLPFDIARLERRKLRSFCRDERESVCHGVLSASFVRGRVPQSFDTVRNEFLQYGYGGYAIEQKSDGAFVGFTGFHNFMFDVDFAPGIEILWRLKQEYWGRGYATEAAKSCLAYAKENLPFSMVRAFTSLTNKRSQRVMQKIGMEFEKNFMHPAIARRASAERARTL